MPKLMIADDEQAICASLQFALETEYEVYTANTEAEILELLHQEEFGIILLDLRLGDSDGLELLTKIKQYKRDIVIIIMTAYGSIQSSVTAMQKGAFYYITKPINMEELKVLLANAAEHLNLKSKIQYLNEKLADKYDLAGMVGKSPAMKQVFNLIEKVKDTETNVMITGESGTGKELVARAIHFGGRRKDESFVVVNCAAIPANLLECEMFGHEKGAFTGAVHSRKGLFELAHKGTIFLDEISEMDINLQSKLLRVVQEKEVTPVGSAVPKKIDVRIICATNRNLTKEITAGHFREDLFYRLNVININVPPLRERVEDIPLLIEYFIRKYSRNLGKNIAGASNGALAILTNATYRGNVRELENIIERAAVLCEEDCICPEDLPGEMSFCQYSAVQDGRQTIPVYIGEDLETVERKVIMQTLKSLGGNRKETAKILKISERNLRYKLKEYGEH